jgi:hypothetical protein
MEPPALFHPPTKRHLPPNNGPTVVHDTPQTYYHYLHTVHVMADTPMAPARPHVAIITKANYYGAASLAQLPPHRRDYRDFVTLIQICARCQAEPTAMSHPLPRLAPCTTKQTIVNSPTLEPVPSFHHPSPPSSSNRSTAAQRAIRWSRSTPSCSTLVPSCHYP